ADGGDQRREPRRTPQRAVGDLFHAVCNRHADEYRDEQAGEDDDDRGKRGVRADQSGDDRQRDHRSYHHDFAVREIDQADDAVDHRVAERNQRIDAAEREAVDDLLQEGFHDANLLSRRGGPRLVADSPLRPTPRQSPRATRARHGTNGNGARGRRFYLAGALAAQSPRRPISSPALPTSSRRTSAARPVRALPVLPAPPRAFRSCRRRSLPAAPRRRP